MNDMQTDILEYLESADCRFGHCERAAAEIRRLRLLLIRKSEALAIVASPSMWSVHVTQKNKTAPKNRLRIWQGTAEFADPMAWAKREAEAEEPDNRSDHV